MRKMNLFQYSRLKPKELQRLQGQDLRSRAKSMNFVYALAARIDGVYGDRFSAIKPFIDCISAREVRYDFCAFKRDVLSKRDVEVGAMLSDYYDKFYVDHKQYTFSEEDEEKYGYIKDGYFYISRRYDIGRVEGEEVDIYFKAIYEDDSKWNQKLYTPISVKSLDICKIEKEIIGTQQNTGNFVGSDGIRLYKRLLQYQDKGNAFIMFSGYKEDWE